MSSEVEGEPSIASQLALTKRFFYGAFGSKCNGLLTAITSFTKAAQLFMAPKNSYFSPLYESKTNIIACNILNAMFDDMFDALRIAEDYRATLFSKLCSQNPMDSGNFAFVSNKALDIETVLGILFDTDGDHPDVVEDTSFNDMWRSTLHYIGPLNT